MLRAGSAGRRAHLLSRPLAQEAAQQAPADPAAASSRKLADAAAARRLPALRHRLAALCRADAGGAGRASRCWRNTADGYAPKPDYRPLTKFENRGLKLGHGVWDLVFRTRLTGLAAGTRIAANGDAPMLYAARLPRQVAQRHGIVIIPWHRNCCTLRRLEELAMNGSRRNWLAMAPAGCRQRLRRRMAGSPGCRSPCAPAAQAQAAARSWSGPVGAAHRRGQRDRPGLRGRLPSCMSMPSTRARTTRGWQLEAAQLDDGYDAGKATRQRDQAAGRRRRPAVRLRRHRQQRRRRRRSPSRRARCFFAPFAASDTLRDAAHPQRLPRAAQHGRRGLQDGAPLRHAGAEPHRACWPRTTPWAAPAWPP